MIWLLLGVCFQTLQDSLKADPDLWLLPHSSPATCSAPLTVTSTKSCVKEGVGGGRRSAAGNLPRRCGGQPAAVLHHQTSIREMSSAPIPGRGKERMLLKRKPIFQVASMNHERLGR